ncbi:MAG: 1-acyl-sn-glycerol-3-phosphate acyltransferase [Paracoccaceae bacterium]|nr:1-acyl-sn-glycerol-3-phosphate acyltransferase [Paracoccaceae bacterium]
MFRTVDVPLWLLLLILAFAGVTFASHFLFPSVRWFFRRRMERVVAELNKRLATPIQPFKLARRHDTIQRLIYDRDVLAAVAEHAKAEGVPEAVAHERALHYAREIVPAFSASAYFGFAIGFAKLVSRTLYHVRITHYDDGLEKIDPEATVVFVMNHRSNMDYVLVTYLVAERAALSYAVGEWARVWPLRSLIRAMGAYFIRRKSRDALYRKVLARYVAMATAAGVTQAVFPEGGLSLDGRLQRPRLGILSYIQDGYDPEARDVVFVPVAVNYDRVLEDRVLIEAQRKGERRFRASIPTIVRFALRYLWQRLRGRFRKFGTAAVGFGTPLSLTEFLARRRRHPTAALGDELMRRVAAVMPVLPVPLVAAELLAAPAPLTEAALAQAVSKRLEAIGRDGTAAEVVAEGLRRLRRRRMIVEDAAGIAANPAEAGALGFYAASIAHLPDAAAARPAAEPANAATAAT